MVIRDRFTKIRQIRFRTFNLGCSGYIKKATEDKGSQKMFHSKKCWDSNVTK